MGHGIAQTFAAAGMTVRCFDQLLEARQSLLPRVQANCQLLLRGGMIDRDAIDQITGHLVVCDSEQEALGDTQIVVEAVREDLKVKRELLQRIEAVVSPTCILASNSSSFPMTQMAGGLQHPHRALNTHWFNPAHLCPLVEVVPGAHTAESMTAITIGLLERAGKMPVRLHKELPGFLINRIQIAMSREVFDLVEKGVASCQDIDRAVRASMGMRLAAAGPLKVWDFADLQIVERVYELLVHEIRSDRKVPDLLRSLVAEGHRGFKSGHGFYDYPPEQRDAELAQRDHRYLELAKLLAGEDSQQSTVDSRESKGEDG